MDRKYHPVKNHPSSKYTTKNHNKQTSNFTEVHTKNVFYGNPGNSSRSTTTHEGAWKKNPVTAQDVFYSEVIKNQHEAQKNKKQNSQKPSCSYNIDSSRRNEVGAVSSLRLKAPETSFELREFKPVTVKLAKASVSYGRNLESLPCATSVVKEVKPVRRNSAELVIEAQITSKKSDEATQLADIKNKFCVVKMQVDEFRGNKDDKLFKYLEEMLTMFLIHLDSMKTTKGTQEHDLRRKLYKEINRSSEELEDKVNCFVDEGEDALEAEENSVWNTHEKDRKTENTFIVQGTSNYMARQEEQRRYYDDSQTQFDYTRKQIAMNEKDRKTENTFTVQETSNYMARQEEPRRYYDDSQRQFDYTRKQVAMNESFGYSQNEARKNFLGKSLPQTSFGLASGHSVAKGRNQETQLYQHDRPKESTFDLQPTTSIIYNFRRETICSATKRFKQFEQKLMIVINSLLKKEKEIKKHLRTNTDVTLGMSYLKLLDVINQRIKETETLLVRNQAFKNEHLSICPQCKNQTKYSVTDGMHRLFV